VPTVVATRSSGQPPTRSGTCSSNPASATVMEACSTAMSTLKSTLPSRYCDRLSGYVSISKKMPLSRSRKNDHDVFAAMPKLAIDSTPARKKAL
jgi:hypothetical protein